MQKILAFITVFAVWSTTPLVIKLSSMGSSAFFAASSRMSIAVIVCFLILAIKNTRLECAKFWQTYLIAGSGIYLTLGLVYISAIHINSGMIAIIFAVTPLITGIFANFILKNNEFDLHKLIATIVGIFGIVIIFLEYITLDLSIFYLSLLFLAMSFQAFISVKLKQINSQASSIQTTTGGLLFSVPFFIISFLIFENKIPQIGIIDVFYILYLAIFGSVFGFISYYYLIKNTSVITVGIIPLITPVFALILGFYFNDELITNIQITGIMVIVLALIYYNYYERFTKLR